MLEWTDEQKMVRDALRAFVVKEIAPVVEELEHGDLPPYDLLRKLFSTFGIDTMAHESFAERHASSTGDDAVAIERAESQGSGFDAGLMLILMSELSRYCPGMVTALGVSVGLTAAAINSRGSQAQRERWVPDLLSLDRIGAWALTEPGAGSDAFGSMRSTARKDPGGGYILNGSKTFITNGPYADVIVFICKLDDGTPPERRKVLSFVLERGMEGLEQSAPLRKMGMHSSPTGEVFVTDVRAGAERLLGEREEAASDAREGAKGTFVMERAGVAAMALGIIERCLELCVDYANQRVQFGRTIGEFQLIQEMLARMEVARLNVQNLVFRTIEMGAAGKGLTLAEASAMKLYSARAATEVALDAV